ncbi:hypothetical protein [Cystobacter fuscus]|uniref:hypothetical protein n=1 Tax=Cystobacter fuscus TaxID=43 RepID=UPI002B2FE7D4|nr:hypothetical protein F0U63_39575 [Cystobacter fuscus]WNG29658.1 hypothetical protein F0U62_40900 [Cystobacter fuscus]
MRLFFVISLLLLSVLPLGGCNRPSYETPVRAYQTFLRAVQRGDEKTAYSALSQPTQEALKQKAQTVANASAGAVKADPVAFFFANVAPPPDVAEVTLAGETGDTAQVNVVFSQVQKQVRMVRETSGWKIDLTQSLQQP